MMDWSILLASVKSKEIIGQVRNYLHGGDVRVLWGLAIMSMRGMGLRLADVLDGGVESLFGHFG